MRGRPGGGPSGTRWAALFRAVMRLYPDRFRRTLGRDMEALFQREHERRNREEGPFRSGLWAAGTVARTVAGALYERARDATGPEAGTDAESGVERAGSSTGTERIRGRTTMGVTGRIDHLGRDLRGVARQAKTQPGFVFVVVVTLALGIGAVTTVYGVVRGVLLAPLPYPGGERIVEFVGGGASSLPNFRDLEARLESMEEMGAFVVPSTYTLTSAGDPVEIRVSQVTEGFFPLLGLRPAAGRFLGPEDDQTERAVLSHGLWTRRFGADPGIVGRTATIAGTSVEVVGVAPAGVTAPFDQDAWIPLQQPPDAGLRGTRAARSIYLYGRVRPGVPLETAREEVVAEFGRLQEEHPEANAEWRVGITTLEETLTGDERRPLLLLLAASALFLAVACANVASVLVSRMETRRREFAIRTALGAGRERLAAQAWTETLALSLVGGALGAGLAVLGVRASLRVFGDSLSRSEAVTVDAGVLLFAFALSLGTALVVGGLWLSGWRLRAPARTLQGAAASVVGGTGAFRRVLVAGQIAVALVLVTGLGLLVKSFANIRAVDLGVRVEDAVVTSVPQLTGERYPDGEARWLFLDRLAAQLEADPAVHSVASTSKLPLSGCCSNGPLALAADPETEEARTEFRFVTPEYPDVVGMRMVAGGSLDPVARPGGAVEVLVNQTLASRLFGDRDPLGASVTGAGLEMVIVGVVGDVREYAPTREPPPAVYASAPAAGFVPRGLVVRTALPAGAVEERLRRIIGELDPLLPVGEVRALSDLAAETLGDRRATTTLMTLLGLTAVLLGAVGIYGVTSHAVHGRRREIGVRLALGASGRGVLAATLGDSIRLVLPGVVLGLVGALAARSVVESLLFGVRAFDPWVYGAVSVSFVAVALLASLLPALRAARVSPAEALAEH